MRRARVSLRTGSTTTGSVGSPSCSAATPLAATPRPRPPAHPARAPSACPCAGARSPPAAPGWRVGRGQGGGAVRVLGRTRCRRGRTAGATSQVASADTPELGGRPAVCASSVPRQPVAVGGDVEARPASGSRARGGSRSGCRRGCARRGKTAEVVGRSWSRPTRYHCGLGEVQAVRIDRPRGLGLGALIGRSTRRRSSSAWRWAFFDVGEVAAARAGERRHGQRRA